MDTHPIATNALGQHWILDLYDCPVSLLTHPEPVKRLMLAAAADMQATVVGAHFHAFSPHGVSGVVIIQESHLTVHTWPEHGYAAIDVFSCGVLCIQAGVDYLKQHFQAGRYELRTLERGTALRQTSQRSDR